MTHRWRPPQHPLARQQETAEGPYYPWANGKPEKKKADPLRCNRCFASGRIPCEMCGGRGQTIIGRDIRGYPNYGSCQACMGSKTMRCRTCGGVGFT